MPHQAPRTFKTADEVAAAGVHARWVYDKFEIDLTNRDYGVRGLPPSIFIPAGSLQWLINEAQRWLDENKPNGHYEEVL